MLKGILIAAMATGTAIQAYHWYRTKSSKYKQAEALQTWEGEGGNLPPQTSQAAPERQPALRTALTALRQM